MYCFLECIFVSKSRHDWLIPMPARRDNQINLIIPTAFCYQAGENDNKIQQKKTNCFIEDNGIRFMRLIESSNNSLLIIFWNIIFVVMSITIFIINQFDRDCIF